LAANFTLIATAQILLNDGAAATAGTSCNCRTNFGLQFRANRRVWKMCSYTAAEVKEEAWKCEAWKETSANTRQMIDILPVTLLYTASSIG
jgi:hypothetical protein